MFTVMVKTFSQSSSLGSVYVASGGETSILGQHNFQNGNGTLNMGILATERSAPVGLFSWVSSNGGSWINASNSAFVDGYARSYGSGAFTFPIGDNGVYRPAAVSTASDANPATAAYYGVSGSSAITSNVAGGNHPVLPSGGPFNTSSKASTISNVDNVEYWDIDGTTAAKITLTWDANSNVNTMTNGSLTMLTIVGWNGTQWVEVPSTVDANQLLQTTSATAFTGSTSTPLTTGSITTNAAIVPSSFTVYTLASKSSINLTIEKSAPTSVSANTNFAYTLKITNKGNVPTTGTITVRDNLPAGIAFLTSTGTSAGWACNANAQLVTCISSTPITVDGDAVIILNVTATASGTYRNTATVIGGGDPSVTPKSSDEVLTVVGSSFGLLSAKAFLQGPFNPTLSLMSDALRTQSLIPSTQPYGSLSDFAYTGTESVAASVLTVSGNNAIVDWVLLELRSASSPSTIIARRAALIQRDGDIVDTDGTSAVAFSGLTLGTNYHVAVRHRNHLGVMTATPVAISSTVSTVNFTSNSTANFNVSSPYAQYTFTNGTSTGIRTMWAGNASGDDMVIFQGPDSDVDYVFSNVFLAPGNTLGDANFIRTNYLRTDLNLDGNTIYQGPDSDTDLVFFNILFYYILGNPSRFPNAIITQQIP